MHTQSHKKKHQIFTASPEDIYGTQVKNLCSIGFPFRDDNSNLGNSCNGNFLALEMISKSDQFLDNHLTKYDNPGKGHNSYLSNYVYVQFTSIKKSRKYYHSRN